MDKTATSTSTPDIVRIRTDDGIVLTADQTSGTGHPLVFAHGFGQNRGSWRSTLQALERHGHPSVAADARGHGDSTWNEATTPYHPDQFVADLIAVTGQFDRAPVLVGASMGGLFGMIAEARWPGLFSAMVLVDITPRWEARGVQRILDFMGAHPEGFDSFAHAADEIARYLPHRERKGENGLRSVLREGADGRLRWHWDPRLLAELGQGAERHQQLIAESAARLRCPVLLLSGGRSDMVSDNTITEFLDLVPHARHIRLPEATHMVAGDDNDAFTTTVMQYLDTLPAIATDGLSATSHLTGATP